MRGNDRPHGHEIEQILTLDKAAKIMATAMRFSANANALKCSKFRTEGYASLAKEIKDFYHKILSSAIIYLEHDRMFDLCSTHMFRALRSHNMKFHGRRRYFIFRRTRFHG